MFKGKAKKETEKNMLDRVWIILFVVLVIGSLIYNIPSLQWCLAKGVVGQDYYKNFLWPEMYGYVNLIYAIVSAVCGGVYWSAATDISIGVSHKSRIHIKNMCIVMTAITGGIYGTVGILYFKNVSLLTIVIGLVIILAVVSIVINVRAYNNLSKDRSLREIIKPVITRLAVIVIAMVGGIVCLGVFLPKIKKDVDIHYNNLCNRIVSIGFGHEVGVENNRGLVKYEFVRMYGDSGREYDLEQLKEEYANFLSGEGSWNNLWYFCHESADVELESQKINIYTGFYPYSESLYDPKNVLADYYDIRGNKNSEERYDAIEEKLGDLNFFCICVEEELNKNGLTIYHEEFSGDDLSNGIIETEYKSATKEELLAACQSFATNIEPVDGEKIEQEYADAIDVSLDFKFGMPWAQLQVSEKHGYMIRRCYVSEYDSINKKYVPLTGDDTVIDNSTYKVTLYIGLPSAGEVAEKINVSIDGVNVNDITVGQDKGISSDVKNRVKIEFTFTAKVDETSSIGSLVVGYEHFRPGYFLGDAMPYDESELCAVDSLEWNVYDVEKGVLVPYEADSFTEENLCYVAVMKIVPCGKASFEEVENLNLYNFYFSDRLNVSEYDEDIHKYTAGSYPKAYFEKYLGDEEYILLYLPYYQCETIGANGYLQSAYTINGYEYGDYIYVPEESRIRLDIKSEPTYESIRYEIRKNDGTEVTGDQVNIYEDRNYYDIPTLLMPAYPIEITGYYE
ncbi:MAG: hypothetical protein IJX12_00320 [Lachnospiraceae bacterium]|nr:hypothetical protein [Lachnospiraceae bacterium]